MTLPNLRKEDRRIVGVAFLILLFLMMSHALLETARDALFLGELPASRLPWAYLAIAVLAVIELRFVNKLLTRTKDRRRLLGVSMAMASVITLGFWFWIRSYTSSGVLSLYVWTGLLVTVVLVQLWLLVGDSVTVTQAKRVFAPIAAGGVSGAVLGSFVADSLLRIVPTATLLLISSAIMLLGAALPMLLPIAKKSTDPAEEEMEGTKQRDGLKALFATEYLRQLFVLVLVGTVALTGVDFVFKSIVAQEVASNELGSFFARFYLTINVLSLGVQLFVSSRVLQAIGVHRSIGILPILLLLSVVGVALFPILASVLLMKGVDGSLRHSLYRTGQEVLYLPLTNRVRSRAKTLIDSFGNRGGQALASVLILLSLSIGATIVQISIFVAVLCVVWAITIAIMQPLYLELFRARLKMGAVETRVGQGELDLHSLETLLNSLSSEDDGEVLAAIDLFSAHGKSSLLPVLLLYHPSKEITLRALQAFTSENDPRFVSVAKRLLRSESEEIRAAALRSLASIDSNQELLKKHLRGDTPAVQATALVGLLATDRFNRDLRTQLNTWLNLGGQDTQVQLARAIGAQREGGFNDALIRLSKVEAIAVRQETAMAMALHPHFDLMPHLLPMLGVSELRSCARRALVALEDPALYFLKKKLADENIPRKVRRHIPRTISRFDAKAASEILVNHMLVEKDGAIRYKSLRGLGRLIATNSSLRLDHNKLDLLIESALVRGLQMIKWRSVSDRHENEITAGASLLYATLVEKEKRLLERTFRLLGLRYRHEDFSLIWRGLSSEDKKIQSASRELLDGALAGPLREAILAMVDDDKVENRIQRASRVLKQPDEPSTYESALVSMLDDSSEAVRCIAAYHIAELGIDDLAPELERARESNQGPVRDAIDRALRVLSSSPPKSEEVPSVA